MNDERDRRRPTPGRQPSGGMPGSGYGPSHNNRPPHGRSQHHRPLPVTPPGDDAYDDSGYSSDVSQVDVGQVHLDDAFIEALSHDVPTPTRDETEYQLAALLSGWRYEALNEPAPALPGIEEVERAIAAQTAGRRGARVVRSLRVIAGAAAIAVVAAAGLTVMSEGASPGDSLWSVKKVVFASAASQTQAAYDVRSDLEQAEAAMASGDVAAAQQLIALAQAKLGPVSDTATRDQMNQWISRLRADETTTSSRPSPQQQTAPTTPDADTTDAGTTEPPTSEVPTTPDTTAPETSVEPSTTQPEQSPPSSTAVMTTSMPS